MSATMLALQRRESGGDKEGDNTLWDGFQLLKKGYSSGSTENLQHLSEKSIAKNKAAARDQEITQINQDAVQGVTPQSEQRMQRQALQETVATSDYPNQEMFSRHVKPYSSLQNECQEGSCRPNLAPSRPTVAKPSNELELDHAHEKDGEEHQERLDLVRTQSEHLCNPKQAKMRSDGIHGSAVHSLAIGSLKSLRRRKPQPWPNPRDSLGEIIDIDSKKIKGNVWVPKGPALELFEKRIRPQVESLLYSTEPPQCAPLLLTLYMIGKKETSANPIIMICCCDRKVRKDAEALIRESDILQQFPQLGLGNSASLLETKASVMPAAGSSTTSQWHTQVPSRLEIHGLNEPVIGRLLRFVSIADGRETVKFTTGGPFIRIEKHTYQLTATHISRDTDPDSEMQSGSDDDCEYDGQSDTDTDRDTDEQEEGASEEDDGHIAVGTGTPRDLREICNTLLETGVMSRIVDSDMKATPERLDRHDLWSAQDTTSVDRTILGSSKVDYFLVKLPDEEAERASNVIDRAGQYGKLEVTNTATSPNPGTKVVVVTAHCQLVGFILPGNTRVKMHGFHGFHNILAVRLPSSIRPGDSGSAVLDASTGCLYGHVTMGSAPDTIAYMVPSIDTLTAIFAAFGKLPTLKIEPRAHTIDIPQRNTQNAQDELSISTSPSDLWENGSELLFTLGPAEAVGSSTTGLRARNAHDETTSNPHETPEAPPTIIGNTLPLVHSKLIPIHDT